MTWNGWRCDFIAVTWNGWRWDFIAITWNWWRCDFITVTWTDAITEGLLRSGGWYLSWVRSGQSRVSGHRRRYINRRLSWQRWWRRRQWRPLRNVLFNKIAHNIYHVIFWSFVCFIPKLGKWTHDLAVVSLLPYTAAHHMLKIKLFYFI